MENDQKANQMNEDWKQKLSPWDAELFRMVESLTGKPCEPKNGGDHFFFEADYEAHKDNPEYLLALWDAIEGRAGKRLIGIDDDPARHVFIVSVLFSNERYPALIRCDRDETENPAAGNPYYPKNGEPFEVWAVQVERESGAQLLAFVGNGELRVDPTPGGKAVFQFKNAGGSVYADAPEHSFVVYRGPGRFEVLPPEQFEALFETK